ncbi:MAG: GNAT family N-acetyltransferase [Acidobacteria bacterium]|nr:GNAT family N-acetyltransferase [Acidobacteriota bacterium]
MNPEISLRPAREEDFPFFFEHQADPVAAGMAVFVSRDREAFNAHWAKWSREPTTQLRAVLVRGQVAGSVVSWQADDGRHLLGYWIDRAFWGRGVASAALTLFLEEISLRPLSAHVAKTNLASIRILEKSGFTLTAEARVALLDGSVREEYVYTLSAGDTRPSSWRFEL